VVEDSYLISPSCGDTFRLTAKVLCVSGLRDEEEYYIRRSRRVQYGGVRLGADFVRNALDKAFSILPYEMLVDEYRVPGRVSAKHFVPVKILARTLPTWPLRRDLEPVIGIEENEISMPKVLQHLGDVTSARPRVVAEQP
jgi:hypothetical protein